MDNTLIYPSRLRRALLIVVYVIALFIIWVFAQYFLLSGRCFLYNECSSVDRTVGLSISIFCLVGALAVFYLGATGRLWGARRKPGNA